MKRQTNWLSFQIPVRCAFHMMNKLHGKCGNLSEVNKVSFPFSVQKVVVYGKGMNPIANSLHHLTIHLNSNTWKLSIFSACSYTLTQSGSEHWNVLVSVAEYKEEGWNVTSWCQGTSNGEWASPSPTWCESRRGSPPSWSTAACPTSTDQHRYWDTHPIPI